MTFKDQFARRYIAQAPLALALERAYECEIHSWQKFEHPILDLGCGDGIFATVLCQDSIDTGIDPDEYELESARRLGGYGELICCAGQKIPKPDGAYRTILSNSVLEHIVDVNNVLKEARRVLADDGRMCITVPTDLFDRFTIAYQLLSALGLSVLAERVRGFFNRFWKHYHAYDAAGWGRLFEECGWVVVRSREYNPKASCLLHDGLVPLSIVSFLSRRFLRRWFVFPWLRRLYAPVLVAIFASTVRRFLPVDRNGGLVFFELGKKRI